MNQRRHQGLAGRAYILQNQVAHVRFLPSPSNHAFVYPTFSLLASLIALEKGELDLFGGRLFGYGTIWNRVTGLRASGYLHDAPGDKRTIKQKLVCILEAHGHPGQDLGNAWLMTMPTFLGIEGINPLTVHFCYRRGSAQLWIVVLEVHNTFGERHVYVLECAKASAASSSGFKYEWIFSRQFHVSPFNDRSGFYKCQIIPPPGPPNDDGFPMPPRPVVKLTLLTSSHEKKLIAIQRATNSTHLSSWSLLSTLVRSPFGLLLALPRILYQAYILHYKKQLHVYQRPEPYALDPDVEHHLPAVPNRSEADHPPGGGSIGWQKKSFLEKRCQIRVYEFLQRRSIETGISIHFIPANPAEANMSFEAEGSQDLSRSVSIYYRSARIFAIIFMMPSPRHALLLGQGENVFSVSSEDLLEELFKPSNTLSECRWKDSLAGRLRAKTVPFSLSLPIPNHHPLDNPATIGSLFILYALIFLGTLEKNLYNFFHAKFVPGDEPWGGWTRLSFTPSWDAIGSFRKDTK
ncbi:hypothetical protein M422DRAFT_31957 [Sphaerobolus stellatus SS14]|uniref:DUF1365-domain-containing protein n=1 Tax=Sphaerobolus stellatus (strain SS14) TaxID=990650 RepID=A0A0C9VI23_SPHS4|nr:hypothetical protein M422DRAFT_31957 [Sphaerobolus stellatus SS14]